jgi:hypothetical protein
VHSRGVVRVYTKYNIFFQRTNALWCVTVRGGGLEAWLGIRPTAAWAIPPPQNIPKRILYQERWQSDGHPLVKGGPTLSQTIFLFLSLASLVMRCFNFNRPPTLHRLTRKTHTRKNGPRMGFFIFTNNLPVSVACVSWCVGIQPSLHSLSDPKP